MTSLSTRSLARGTFPDISTDDDVTAAASRDPPADNGTTASDPKSDPEPEWPTTSGSPTDARSEDAGSYPATTAAQPGDAHRGGPAGGDVSTQSATSARTTETTTTTTGTTGTTTTTTTKTTTTTERPTTTREGNRNAVWVCAELRQSLGALYVPIHTSEAEWLNMTHP